MNPFLAIGGIVAILFAFLVAGTIDYNESKATERPIYSYPAMEAPCREPEVATELRIWVDKRLSEKEGVRTCRVIPIKGDASPKMLYQGVIRDGGVRG